MSIPFSGVFILDFLVLFCVLLLPIPTTPYLIYIYTSYSIQEAAFMFFVASNLEHVGLYYVGFYTKLVHLKKISSRFSSFTNKSVQAKALTIYEKAKKFSIDKLENSNAYDIFVARWVGVHPIIVCLGLGRIKARISPLLIANNVYVIIDILFYWVLIGSGTFLLNRFFPGTNLEELLDIKYIYPLSVSFLLLTYVAYGVYKWRSSHK